MDPKQGLCLGAIFDIAATNVSDLIRIILQHEVYCLCFCKYQVENIN